LALHCIVYLYALRMARKGYWFVVLIFMGSCLDEPDCFQLSNNYIGITFKKLFDGKADTLTLFGITAPSTDSIFYPFKRAVSVQLELNPYESSTDFTFQTIYGSQQLAIGYRSSVQFVSEECGIRTLLSDLQIGDHDFDSIRLVNPALSNPPVTNLEVYRCPRTNQLKLAFRKLVNNVAVADTVQFNNVTADYPASFYFPGEEITTINLPLNAAANTTTFTFEFIDGTTRTLTVQHTRTGWDEYEQCGNTTLFYDLESTASTFSQVNVVRDSIQDPPITNFAIFR
jgi:hypothetical protein